VVEGWRSGVAQGLWALALMLAACPGPQAVDAGTGSSGGTNDARQGPCSDAGLCPADQYCQALITECGGQPGVTVPSGQPGVCYLEFPCADLPDENEAEPDCSGSTCNSDNDCGLSAQVPNTALTCQQGFCDLPGQGLGGEGGSSSSGGSGGSSGSPQGPLCPRVPNPCPAGCTNIVPLYGCPSCLCDQCPPGDAGVADAGTDAGPGDAGADGG
jgi:hypothetical protein